LNRLRIGRTTGLGHPRTAAAKCLAVSAADVRHEGRAGGTAERSVSGHSARKFAFDVGDFDDVVVADALGDADETASLAPEEHAASVISRDTAAPPHAMPL
jgi:hypothetical protein